MTTTHILSEVVDEFVRIAHRQVWCNVATIDTGSRPRSRVLHPMWEILHEEDTVLLVGWIATGRQSLKARHIQHRPYVSVCYMGDPLKPVYAECAASWVDDAEVKQRIWTLLATTPPPLGYDPAPFFGTVDNASYGLLRLVPWRVELADLFGEGRVWRA